MPRRLDVGRGTRARRLEKSSEDRVMILTGHDTGEPVQVPPASTSSSASTALTLAHQPPSTHRLVHAQTCTQAVTEAGGVSKHDVWGPAGSGSVRAVARPLRPQSQLCCGRVSLTPAGLHQHGTNTEQATATQAAATAVSIAACTAACTAAAAASANVSVVQNWSMAHMPDTTAAASPTCHAAGLVALRVVADPGAADLRAHPTVQVSGWSGAAKSGFGITAHQGAIHVSANAL